jgi:hypothetical protein
MPELCAYRTQARNAIGDYLVYSKIIYSLLRKDRIAVSSFAEPTIDKMKMSASTKLQVPGNGQTCQLSSASIRIKHACVHLEVIGPSCCFARTCAFRRRNLAIISAVGLAKEPL